MPYDLVARVPARPRPGYREKAADDDSEPDDGLPEDDLAPEEEEDETDEDEEVYDPFFKRAKIAGGEL